MLVWILAIAAGCDGPGGDTDPVVAPEEAPACGCGGTETFVDPGDADWLLDVPSGQALSRLELELPEASRAALTGPDAEWDTLTKRRVCATLHTPYGTLTDVAVRLKGKRHNSYQPLEGKPYLELDFAHCAAETGRTAVSGLAKVRLYNQWQDASQVQRYLGYWIWRRLGHPAPRAGFARLAIDGEDKQLYGVSEIVDAAFLAQPEWGFAGGTGNLYEGEYGLDFTADDVPVIEREQVLTATPDDLQAIADVVDRAVGATPSDLEAELVEARMPRLHDFLALEVAIGAREGYSFVQNNWYLYTEPDTQRSHLIPWGFDQVLYDLSIMPDRPLGLIPLRGLDQPAFHAAQCAALERVVQDDVWAVDAPAEMARVLAVLDAEGFTAYEPWSLGEVEQMRGSVGYFLEARPLQLQAWIDASCPP